MQMIKCGVVWTTKIIIKERLSYAESFMRMW